MKIISLGGVGGCPLKDVLKKLNYPTYPYDWLFTTQSYIINNFNNFDKFFCFDTKYVYDNNKLLNENKTAIMLHDFTNFDLEKMMLLQKYKRRFERLNDALLCDEDILFIRLYDNLEVDLVPLHYYDNIFVREKEDIEKWNDFIKNLIIIYKKNIKLLLIEKKNDAPIEDIIKNYLQNNY